jgi:type I restriction enzyme S subunit
VLKRLLARSIGSVFPSLSAPDIKGIPVVSPERSVADRFQRLVDPLLLRTESNVRESEALGAIRDTLLPKLISGELRVKEAAEQISDTTEVEAV